MAKRQPSFACQSCGAVTNRWKGKCEACGGWNTIVEEVGAMSAMAGPVATRPSRAKGRIFALEGLSGETREAPRMPSGIGELDRVTGGGFVHGSVILIGGDPGIGKSTLLTQASAALANQGHRVAYISGEEAVAQVRLRAERLGLGQAPVELASETNVEDIIATLSQGRPPALAIIDSIQTMWTETVESAPGTVTQVRGSAQALIRFAKTTGTVVILVGHVTKDGTASDCVSTRSSRASSCGRRTHAPERTGRSILERLMVTGEGGDANTLMPLQSTHSAWRSRHATPSGSRRCRA